MDTGASSHTRSLEVSRWPTERPLFAAVAVCSVFVWIVLIATVIGLFYAVLLGAFFFIGHVVFISHVRGSGVKLGPDQFPDLHEAIERLSRAMGQDPPEAYILQSGGSLNALATRFFRRRTIVLYSDLLEACGDNAAARDMIIAHELAHLKCGHLDWQWFILPGLFIPFLGSALCRAREYTCDRYGLAGAGDHEGGLRGLTILAAGSVYGSAANLEAFSRQRADLNTGWMTLAEWFSTHPPLSKRVVALSSRLDTPDYSPLAGNLRALGIVGTLGAVMIIGVGGAVAIAWLGRAGALASSDASLQVEADFQLLDGFIRDEWSDTGPFPKSVFEIRERWEQVRPDEPMPSDPFDGYDYGYVSYGEWFEVWSSGTDGEAGTADDIYFESR